MRGLSRSNFPPVFVAAFIQLVVFLALLSIEAAAKYLAKSLLNIDIVLTISIFIFIQSGLSAIFTYWIGMEKWWCWIQFLFPTALMLALDWQFPPEFFLIAFFVSLSLYWTTFKTQVPFYPSHHAVLPVVLALLPPERSLDIRVVEIGSGLGGMSLYLARQRPDVLVEGIENAPLPWFISKLRGALTRSCAVFHFGDYRRKNFSCYDLMFAYLSPAAMPALWKQCVKEMRPGSMLVSYEFDVPGIEPTQVIVLPETMRSLYIWHFS